MNPQNFPSFGWLVILKTPYITLDGFFEDVICWCLTRGDAEDLLAARGNDSAYRIQPAGPA
jgi:hypothetical protein